MKKLIIVLLCALVLGGCSAKEQSTVCKLEKNGMTQQFTLNAKGDTITSTHEEMTFDLSQYADNEETLAMAKDALKAQIDSQFAGKEGIAVNYVDNGESLLTTIDIDMEKTTIEDLVELGMVGKEENSTDALSLKLSVEAIKEAGFTCGE